MMLQVGRRVGAVLLGLCVWLGAAQSWAQTGVSADRVSLPEGPGSLEGIGENVSVNPNMGQMAYSVPIRVPKGFPMVTPNLSLSYSSGGGGSVVGMGWSMAMPSIERMTYRRLPQYNTNDDFAAGGGQQLVRLPGTNPPVYRARYEGGFSRYTWMEAGDGSEGYWIAEMPDGSKAYFGADSQGNIVPEARDEGPDGTFCYKMVEKVDVYGHRMVVFYRKFGNYALPTELQYVFTNGEPSYRVAMIYEPREDETGQEFLSDGAPGFDLLLTQRLARVEIFSHTLRIRRYFLSYESYAQSGGFTRLSRVEMKGLENGTYPIVFDFGYSQALGGVCEGDDCQEPFVVDMGSLGVNLAAGRTTLVDINGDALPDVVDTSQQGAHRFFLGAMNEDGSSQFEFPAITSQVGNTSSHNLSSPFVQVLDVNGDGRSDMVNTRGGQILVNDGSGDWSAIEIGAGTEGLGDALGSDFEEGQLQTLQFLDYNNDKLIDVMRANLQSTTFFENRGEEGFEVVTGATQLGVDFSAVGTDLTDMNGDGLLDVVRLQPESVRYWLNLGWGRFADPVLIGNLPLTPAEVEIAELEDLNGDGMADLVIVVGSAVKVALNTNGAAFGQLMTFQSSDVQGDIPVRDEATTVLFADMNANGSSDIVWIGSNGQTRYLELFPIRPNLLSRITNGIGMVTDVTYETAAIHMARDGGWRAWEHRLPYPMQVVAQTDTYDLLTDLHEINRYRYHSGFYDGIEKQYRGFERVETQMPGDDFHESGLTRAFYDVGAEDPYRNGLMLTSEVFSADRPLGATETIFEDCPVAEVPQGTEFPVRYVCQTRMVNTVKEGADESQWVTTEARMQYDGYGNVVRSENLGITAIGGQGCEPCADRPEGVFGEPCGAQCIGDETYDTAQYVPTDQTGGRWIISTPFRTQRFGADGSDLKTETLKYYDGPAFEGLPLGFLEQGNATRTTVKVYKDSQEVIEAARHRFDRHGNAVEMIGPLGEVDGQTHRRVYTYDRDGLRLDTMEALTEDRDGQPYRLRQRYTYEDAFDRVSLGSGWLLVEDGQVQTERPDNLYFYDQFGRMIRRVLPGSVNAGATEEISYDLGSPVSRIITRHRSELDGQQDIESIVCMDGRGRAYQKRARLDSGLYQVTGFSRYDVRGLVVETFQPYLSDSDQCDLNPPEGTLSATFRYDATGRPLGMTSSDEAIYGQASQNRTEYGPLERTVFDAEDMDPQSPFFNTPTITRVNGRGEVVERQRLLEADQPPSVTTLQYDGLGRMIGYIDPQSNQKFQDFDLLGRVMRIEDPNTGAELTYEYDAASNLTRIMDERGIIARAAFDGVNRLIERWDERDREGTLIERFYDKPELGCDPQKCTLTPWRISAVSYPGLNPGERFVDTFGYDERSRPIWRGVEAMGHLFEERTVYDNANRPVSVTYADGGQTRQVYDDDGRVVEIPGFFSGVTFDERGLLLGAEAADGTTCSMSYDDVMRPLQRVTTDGQGEVLQGFEYAYDRIGHIVSIGDLAEPTAGLPTADARFAYDAWYRLTEATLSAGGGFEERLEYTYDSVDKVMARASSLGSSSPVHVPSFDYSAQRPHAVSEAAGVTMAYDEAGNMVQRGAMTMQWDFLGRLAGAQVAGHDVRHVYGHDEQRRVRLEDDSTTIYLSDEFVVRDGIASRFVLFGGAKAARVESDVLATALMTDLDDDGQINAADAWLSVASEQGFVDVDEAQPSAAGAMLWSSVRRLLMDDGPVFLHHDHQGSLTLATQSVDGQTQVVGQRRFYPGGADRGPALGFVSEYGYTGQEFDRLTGLNYHQHRYLDPVLGRWVSIDPGYYIADPNKVMRGAQGTTAYAFVSNDPVNNVDLNGLDRVALAVGYTDSMTQTMVQDAGGAWRNNPNYDNYIHKLVGHFVADQPHTVQRAEVGAAANNLIGRHNFTTPGSELVLLGHGSTDGARFGTSPSKGGVLMNASQLVSLLINEGLQPGDLNGLEIKLHGCATASLPNFFGTSLFGTSFAQKFAQALAQRGFRNFKVVGYHGFVRESRVAKNIDGNDQNMGTEHSVNDASFQSHFETTNHNGRTRVQKTHGKTTFMKNHWFGGGMRVRRARVLSRKVH